MTERPLIDISPENWQIVRSILERYIPDREVWAFGSRAKWAAKEFSDLDIAVIGNEPMDIGLMADLSEAFQESALPFKVDIVDWATITTSFRKVIETAKVQLQQPRTMEGWTVRLVSDVAVLNPSRSLKKGAVSPFIEMAALPVNGRDIPVQDVTTREFSGSGARFMDGDALLARITPCLENGKTALVNVLGPSVVGHGSTEFIVLSAKEASDQRFIYYLARHPDFREYAIQHMEGTSGRQRVSAGSIGAYRFLCPPASQRKDIGETLGVLDDKISLLRETNTTLEAITQALFKSWFVDFDPVRAKAEGREPEGMPPEVADLFPSEFEDSELGEIPKGWRRKPFSEAIEILGGGTPKTSISEYWGGEIPWFSVADAPMESDVFVIDTEKKITQLGLNNSSARLLPEGTTIITARGTVGKVALVGVPMAMNQSCYGLKDKDAGAYFTYYATRMLVSSLRLHSHGSVFDTITRDTLAGVSLAIPSKPISEAFENTVMPLMQRIKCNLEQASSLATIRDTLLPRLMSGKLRLTESASISEAAL